MPSNGTEPQPTVALAAFDPERFGWRAHGDGWRRAMPGIGTVAIAPLAWQHAHAPAGSATGSRDRHERDALSLLVELQMQTWGFPPADVVPANMLAILAETGGSVLVAYDAELGFTVDGWLGFAIAAGARSGVLVSHMLGVRDRLRGANDLGFSLKVAQGYLALQSGHNAATWTFDPMRGANARLNLAKLGATADRLTIDKYGRLASTLYGVDVPTDRLTANWDLHAPRTHRHIQSAGRGRTTEPDEEALAAVPEVDAATLATRIRERPPRLRLRIPGDIDRLSRDDPPAALRWRQRFRDIASRLVTTDRAEVGNDRDPASIIVATVANEYRIDGFVSRRIDDGDRANWYLLRRQPS